MHRRGLRKNYNMTCTRALVPSSCGCKLYFASALLTGVQRFFGSIRARSACVQMPASSRCKPDQDSGCSVPAVKPALRQPSPDIAVVCVLFVTVPNRHHKPLPSRSKAPRQSGSHEFEQFILNACPWHDPQVTCHVQAWDTGMRRPKERHDA